MASLAFTRKVSALRTHQHRARRARRRCSFLQARACGVLSPCLARRSRHWRGRSTAVS